MIEPELVEPGAVSERHVLLWRFVQPVTAIASTAVGGGIGRRGWAVSMEVDLSYSRTDLAAHVAEVADGLGCGGEGVGFLTAASVRRWTSATDEGVEAVATVGLSLPTWAASTDPVLEPPAVGTVNTVVWLPVRLGPAALVNAVATATEAKVQALIEAGIDGTGTASDAVCVLCPAAGPTHEFAGPRSRWGAPMARAVHRAVADGAADWFARHG